MPTIRKAQPGDSKELSKVAEATFRATFGALNTAEHMELHCRSSYSEQIQRTEISNPGMVTLLCEDGEELIGFAQLRWGEAPAFVAARKPGEIQRLYVVAGWHGKGIAQDLMKACIDEMKQRGSDAVWLGVWERNPRAISFYKKFGFFVVGDHMFALGGDPQRDVVMARAVDTELSI